MFLFTVAICPISNGMGYSHKSCILFLNRFEAEENRYFAPLNWMIPRDAYSMASGSSSSSFSNAPGASRQNSLSRPFRMSTQGTLNETVGF